MWDKVDKLRASIRGKTTLGSSSPERLDKGADKTEKVEKPKSRESAQSKSAIAAAAKRVAALLKRGRAAWDEVHELQRKIDAAKQAEVVRLQNGIAAPAARAHVSPDASDLNMAVPQEAQNVPPSTFLQEPLGPMRSHHNLRSGTP